MQQGRIVDIQSRDRLTEETGPHPYTRSLVAASRHSIAAVS
jgi:ABC-type oligopeptide transport system ATPase subunit